MEKYSKEQARDDIQKAVRERVPKDTHYVFPLIDVHMALTKLVDSVMEQVKAAIVQDWVVGTTDWDAAEEWVDAVLGDINGHD